MRDLRHRLDRPFAGESLLGVPPLVLRLARRDRPIERPSPIPAREARGPETTLREVRPPVSPSPNTPLLIRVVKFPYALAPGRPGREALPESVAGHPHPTLPPRERRVEALAPSQRRPTDRPRPAAPRRPRDLAALLLGEPA